MVEEGIVVLGMLTGRTLEMIEGTEGVKGGCEDRREGHGKDSRGGVGRRPPPDRGLSLLELPQSFLVMVFFVQNIGNVLTAQYSVQCHVGRAIIFFV